MTMPTTTHRGHLATGLALAAVLMGAGCPTPPQEPAPKPCCDQPALAAGVARLVVVRDDIVGSSDAQKVALRAGLAEPVKRDRVYPVLHTLYRHVMKRGPFEPIEFSATVYANEADARAGSDNKVLARISRAQSDMAPRCENRVPFTFEEQIANAFAASFGAAPEEDSADTCHLAEKKVQPRVDAQFAHKPVVKPDAAQKSASVTFPYLVSGKDEYVKDLKFNSAMRDWIEFTTSLFRRVEALQNVTFTGLVDDVPAVHISMTRQQFDSTFSGLQETIAAHASVTFQTLGMRKNSDKAAEKEQETFRSKTYKSALALLPKAQVTVSPKLK